MAATVDPTPASSTAPISQSMDGHNSSGHFSGDDQSDPPATGSPDRSSSTPSPSRQLDFQIPALTKIEEYRQLFRLPPDEVLIQDFNCALQDNFLLQGHMYLFVHNICFYSNLFGFETKKVIPFHEVTSVRRANAVGVFPTAIEVIAGEKKFFFTSFLSRDEAFRLISDGWLQHSNGSKEIKDQQEPKSEIISQILRSAIIEKSESFRSPANESEITESDRNGHVVENSTDHFEPEIVSTSSSTQVREEENAESVQNIECSSSKKSSVWETEDADAPGVPESFTKVAESKFPICAEEFFNLFFSDNGVNFQESFHRKCGDKDFKCSSWRPDAKFGHTRSVSFQHPIKIYFGSRFGSCQELQTYRVYRNSHLIVDTSQDISDVPYGDYFSVEARWDLEEQSSGSTRSCILRVYVNVAFSKKTMWKGKIVQSTVEETREAYATWIELAHEVLKQKNLEKEEGSRASSLVSDEPILLETKTDIQNNVAMNSSILGISQTIPDVNPLVTSPLQGSIGESSVGSLNFLTYLKRQKSPALLLVATLAVILILMQISIIVLMSRPQRIHVISQSDCTRSLSGIGESRGEIADSLKKQIRYLKEEMHFMETLLDKMQHEHSLLKEKLKDLEFFRNQRI